MTLSQFEVAKVIAPIIMISSEAEIMINKVLKEKHQVSYADFKIMRPVQVFGTCSQVEIASFNQISEAAVSKRINTLIERGYLKRKTSSSDPRSSSISLTIKGKAVMAKVLLSAVNQLNTVLESFPVKKRKELSGLLLEVLGCFVKHSERREMYEKSSNPLVKAIHKMKHD